MNDEKSPPAMRTSRMSGGFPDTDGMPYLKYCYIMTLLLNTYILMNMVNIIDKFLQDLKTSGTEEKILRDYSKFLKNINRQKSLDKWDKTDVNKYVLEKYNECFAGAQICKVKLKRFFIWAGKSELVSHLNT